MEHLPAPKADFTAVPECYQKYMDWVEECELFLNGPLTAKNKAVKLIMFLFGQERLEEHVLSH